MYRWGARAPINFEKNHVYIDIYLNRNSEYNKSAPLEKHKTALVRW